MDCIAIIPARFESNRFPGKLLASLAGRPVIQHTVERCLAVPTFEATIVATDDDRIGAAAEAAGAEVVMTGSEFRCGTERVAAAAERYDAGIVVNVQGDEALLDSVALGTALEAFRTEAVELGTLRAPLTDPADLWNPDVVKLVVDHEGRALYFSRAPIPFPRAQWRMDREANRAEATAELAFTGSPRLPGPFWMHLGVYLYRRDALARWAALPLSGTEVLEGLEQLRALEAGEVIQSYLVEEAIPAINTPDDLERARAAYAAPSHR